MSNSEHVSVTVTVDSLGLARAGFGVALLMSHTASFPERIRFYTDVAGVAADFPVTTSPEYLGALAYFGQNPHPSRLAIGRMTGTVTQNYAISTTAFNSTLYEISVKGEGVTSEVVQYTSDASATLTEISAGLKVALDAVVGRNFTVTDNLDGTLDVASTAANDWFSLEPLNYSRISITQDHVAPSDVTIATDLGQISDENDDWYFAYSFYNSTAYIADTMAYIEAVTKMYMGESSDIQAILVAETSGTDILDDIDEQDLTRTPGVWHPAPADMYGLRLMGRCLPLTPGTETWAYKQLTGVAARALTATHRTNLQDRRATYHKPAGGISFSWQGQLGDSTFGFIDLRRFVDKWVDDLQLAGLETLAGNDSVPLDDEGLALIRAELRGVNSRLIGLGLSSTPAPDVVMPKKADLSAADLAARNVSNIKVSGTYQNSVHTMAINLVLSL